NCDYAKSSSFGLTLAQGSKNTANNPFSFDLNGTSEITVRGYNAQTMQVEYSICRDCTSHPSSNFVVSTNGKIPVNCLSSGYLDMRVRVKPFTEEIDNPEPEQPEEETPDPTPPQTEEPSEENTVICTQNDSDDDGKIGIKDLVA